MRKPTDLQKMTPTRPRFSWSDAFAIVMVATLLFAVLELFVRTIL